MIRWVADRGSALLLMPAGFVIVLVLAAIATDLAVVRLAHREAVDAASAAADVAVTAAVDQERLRRGEGWHLDDAATRAAVAETLRFHHLDDQIEAVDIEFGPGPGQITIGLRVRVEYVFARALPGADHTSITARGTATVVQR